VVDGDTMGGDTMGGGAIDGDAMGGLIEGATSGGVSGLDVFKDIKISIGDEYIYIYKLLFLINILLYIFNNSHNYLKIYVKIRYIYINQG
jgi:hypothetical protein